MVALFSPAGNLIISLLCMARAKGAPVAGSQRGVPVTRNYGFRSSCYNLPKLLDCMWRYARNDRRISEYEALLEGVGESH